MQMWYQILKTRSTDIIVIQANVHSRCRARTKCNKCMKWWNKYFRDKKEIDILESEINIKRRPNSRHQMWLIEGRWTSNRRFLIIDGKVTLKFCCTLHEYLFMNYWSIPVIRVHMFNIFMIDSMTETMAAFFDASLNILHSKILCWLDRAGKIVL